MGSLQKKDCGHTEELYIYILIDYLHNKGKHKIFLTIEQYNNIPQYLKSLYKKLE